MELTGKQRTAIVAVITAVIAALAAFGIGRSVGETKTVTKTVTAPTQPLGVQQRLAVHQALAAAFPTTSTTGVPAGTVLSAYTGSLSPPCGTVIDSKTVNGDLTIRAGNGTRSASTPCVTIRKSLIKGIIDLQWTGKGYGPVVMTDSEVANPRTADVAAVSQSNIFMWRTYVHGARSGVQCDGYCYLYDNVLVADRESGSAHMDGFISNGNYGNPMVVDHNSILCSSTLGDPVPNGAGCAADSGLFGDFSDVNNTTFTNNLLRASGTLFYCFDTPYLPKPHPNGGNNNISGNRWESGSSGKCGDDGPVNGTGSAINKGTNLWCNNVWLDGANAGKPVLPGIADNCGSTPPTTVTTTTVVQPTTSLSLPPTTPPPLPTTTTRPPATTTTTPNTPTTQCLTAPRPKVCTVAGT